MSEPVKAPTVADVRHTCLGMRTRKAGRVVNRVYNEALKPLGVNGAQFTLLVAIAEGAGRSISFLADVMQVERTAVTRNLRVLERQGWIAIGEEGRRRQRSIEILDAGREILHQGLPLWQQAQTKIVDQLGEDRELARRVLDKLAALD